MAKDDLEETSLFSCKDLFQLVLSFILGCMTKYCNLLSSRQRPFAIRPLDLSVTCTQKIFVHIMRDLESNGNEATKLHYKCFN